MSEVSVWWFIDKCKVDFSQSQQGNNIFWPKDFVSKKLEFVWQVKIYLLSKCFIWMSFICQYTIHFTAKAPDTPQSSRAFLPTKGKTNQSPLRRLSVMLSTDWVGVKCGQKPSIYCQILTHRMSPRNPSPHPFNPQNIYLLWTSDLVT